MVVLVAVLAAVPVHGSVGAGAGNAYDVAGIRLELGAGPVTALLGLGYPTWNNGPDKSLSAGLRWSFLRDADGPAVAVHGAWIYMPPATNGDFRETLVMLSATLSWRWRFGPLFLEAGAGPAITLDAYRFPSEDYGVRNGVLSRNWMWGMQPGGVTSGTFPFDIDAGIGFAF